MSAPESTSNRCYSLLCDLLCVTVTVACVCTFLLSMESFHMEKSTATSGSGFHLLSCPKLFIDKDENEYTDIHLNKESTSKLMTMLEDAVQHARVLHTGTAHKKGPLGMHNSVLYEAVEQQLGTGTPVDVNVPRRVDNLHLCDILKSIVDEQDKTTLPEGDKSAEDDGSLVTISIMKLETQEKESMLLRGARMVRNSPIIDDVVMRWSRLDGKIRKGLAVKMTGPPPQEEPLQESSTTNDDKEQQPVVHLEGTLSEDAVQVA